MQLAPCRVDRGLTVVDASAGQRPLGRVAVQPGGSPAEHERGRAFFVDDHDGDRGSLAVVVRHGASLVGGKVAGDALAKCVVVRDRDGHLGCQLSRTASGE